MQRNRSGVLRRLNLMPILGALLALPVAQAQGLSPAQAATPAAAPTRVHVDAFDVDGNTLLPASQLASTLQPFTGDRTLDDLTGAAAAVQALYREAGYGAVVAWLPQQSLDSGRVRIAVLEGHVGEIRVKGNSHFSADNIRASLPGLQSGRTPPMRRLDAQIALANENPAKHVEVLLQPGAKSGDVDANLTVAEQQLQRWTLRADNSGDARTGHARVAAGWQHADISGHDDVLSAELETSPSKPDDVIIVSSAYRLPLYAQALALDAYVALSDIDGGTTSTAAGGLTFTGKGDVVGLRANAYLARLGEADQHASVGLEDRLYKNSCQIEGLPAGACGPAGESVSVQPLSLGWSLQSGGTAPFGLNLSLIHNLQLGLSHSSAAAFQSVRPGSTPHYTLLRMNTFGAVVLPLDMQLQARLVAQFTHHGLVPGEQFGIGGGASVRGYEERELAGDSGAALSVELYSPELAGTHATEGLSVHLLGFGDAGWVRNELGTACLGTDVECSLGSLGVGARVSAGTFQGRLDTARAFKDGAATHKGDWRLHVAVSYSF
jgi:hemolysin activation/secretion protein